MPTALTVVGETISVVPWPDPVLDTVGHDPRSAYVERFWLGVMGPSTVWLIRHLADGLERAPSGFTLNLLDTARILGLASNGGRINSLLNAIERSCLFGAARFDGTGTLAVHRRLPPLNQRQITRLPESLRRQHQQWQERELRNPEAERMRQRARRLALSLLELGEPFAEAERQLHRWKFHPALAFDAMRWAQKEYDKRQAAGRSGNETTESDRLVTSARSLRWSAGP
ncbi:MAG: hypothetical protein N2037_13690 [Acidimicrobiales bacterium]|nr:hypothetical protein [Acidimicrobiales bacterium]